MQDNIERNVQEGQLDILRQHGYQCLHLLGKGATGAVYCVQEVRTGQRYACKVSGSSRLVREAAIMKQALHPLFPQYKEFWQEKGTGYLVMEYICGSNLEQLLSRRGRLSQRQAVRITMELASGLASLQEGDTQLVYGDIKPENMILQPDGRIRLLDMEMAEEISEHGKKQKLTHLIAGTPAYAPPEQWDKEAVPDIRRDIFAIGRILHYMLTGIHPGKYALGELPPIRTCDKRLWRGLERIVFDCLTPLPRKRIPSMRELLRRLSVYHNATPKQIAWLDMKNCIPFLQETDFSYEKNVWKF